MRAARESRVKLWRPQIPEELESSYGQWGIIKSF